ncbi:MAG: hypothetical protein ACLTX3_08340 [Lachnospiraceae bacterium]
MDKFQVGNTYQAICWFTGAMFTYQCVKRTDTEITFSSISEEVDGIHDMGRATYPIHQDDGTEYVVIQTYQGEENRMYADAACVKEAFFVRYAVEVLSSNELMDCETLEEAQNTLQKCKAEGKDAYIIGITKHGNDYILSKNSEQKND